MSRRYCPARGSNPDPCSCGSLPHAGPPLASSRPATRTYASSFRSQQPVLSRPPICADTYRLISRRIENRRNRPSSRANKRCRRFEFTSLRSRVLSERDRSNHRANSPRVLRFVSTKTTGENPCPEIRRSKDQGLSVLSLGAGLWGPGDKLVRGLKSA
jgi:hypothetical protein